MRIFVFSLISCILFSACSHKEQIAQYEQQLKESNEAIEKIIDFRMSSFNAAASENPEKAGPWAKKAQAYFYKCQEGIKSWPLNDAEANNFIASLQVLQPPNFDKSFCPLNSLSLQSESAEIAKNAILTNLNCYLRTLHNNIGHSDRWFDIFVSPLKLNLGDSILVMLEGNLVSPMPEFVISFDNPSQIKLNTSTSLGFFFLPKSYEDSILTGQVEFFGTDYSRDVRHYPFKVDSGYQNYGANTWFHTPPKSLPYNPQKNP